MLYRRRTVHTPNGSIETPVLFPVRNIGKRASDNTPEYTDSIPEFNTAMVNARAIRQRETVWEEIKSGSSLREVMDVPDSTIVFADSGGFDFSSAELDTTPEETIQTQRELNADIFGTVDVPLDRDRRGTTNEQFIEDNIQRAVQASQLHEGEALLFGSVHGYDPETVRNGIRYLEENGNFDGYALGSLVPIRTDYKKVTKLILAARRSTDKHLHVYGLGGIVYQPLLLYLGVDSFDSSAFIRSAGNRNYLLPGFGGQTLRSIEDLQYLPCSCPVCGTRTLDAIREDRSLLTRHNLWAMAIELRRFRYMVEAGEDIEDYLHLRFQGNEVTARAFETAKQQVRRLA